MREAAEDLPPAESSKHLLGAEQAKGQGVQLALNRQIMHGQHQHELFPLSAVACNGREDVYRCLGCAGGRAVSANPLQTVLEQ